MTAGVRGWLRKFGSPPVMFVWCGINAGTAIDLIFTRGNVALLVACIITACCFWHVGWRDLNADIERYIRIRDAQRGE